MHLRGLVLGSAVKGDAKDKVIFQLPDGYRPAAQELRIIQTKRPEIKDVEGESDFGRLDIGKEGDVIPSTPASALKISIGSAGKAGEGVQLFTYWVSLDGISFRAA